MRHYAEALLRLGFISICGLAVAIFLRGYSFASGVDCFQFPDSQPWLYPAFVARMASVVLPLNSVSSSFRIIIGGSFFLVAATVCLYHIRRLVIQPDSARNLSLVIVVLVTFSVLFAINTAIGRLCLGLEASEAPRYIPCLLPGVFAVYLHFLAFPSITTKVLRGLLVAALLWAAFPLSAGDVATINRYSSGKKAWKDAFLRTENADTADRESGFRVHPAPVQTRLQEKLEFLKKHKLNLYLDQ